MVHAAHAGDGIGLGVLGDPPGSEGDGGQQVEGEVLALVAGGLSNTEIGERLHITPGTAKTHVSHLLTKLDAHDRVQLVIIAFRTGLVGA